MAGKFAGKNVRLGVNGLTKYSSWSNLNFSIFSIFSSFDGWKQPPHPLYSMFSSFLMFPVYMNNTPYTIGRNIQGRHCGSRMVEWLIILVALHIFILILDLDIIYRVFFSVFLFRDSFREREGKIEGGFRPLRFEFGAYYNFNNPGFHQRINS